VIPVPGYSVRVWSRGPVLFFGTIESAHVPSSREVPGSQSSGNLAARIMWLNASAAAVKALEKAVGHSELAID
jgi:hypothetical protein